MRYSSVKSRPENVYPPAFVQAASLFAKDVATRSVLSEHEVESIIYTITHHLSWNKGQHTANRIKDFFIDHKMLHRSGAGYLVDSPRIQEVLGDWACGKSPSLPEELVGRTDVLREQHNRGESQPTLDVLAINIVLPYADVLDASGWTREQAINFLAWAGVMISAVTERLEDLS